MAFVVVINCYVLDVFPLLICVPLHICTLIFIFRCVRYNSEYQVHVMERVRYVG
jgi:hypothetical protein